MISLLIYYLILGAVGIVSIQQKKFMTKKYKIVGFNDEVTVGESENILQNHDIKIKKRLPLANACLCLVDEKASSFKTLAADAKVEFIEDDYTAQIQMLPSAAYSGIKIKSQSIPWGINKIEAPGVWKRCKGEGIKVGIIDTGIDREHPDLKDNIKAAYGILDSKKIVDDNGHGTHVAGTIAALDNNIGVVGVAPKAEIYSVKAFDAKGRGQVSDIIDALNWCVEKQVHVINMSFGFNMKSRALERAIRAADKHNIVMVAAAGNSGGTDSVLYPAKYSEVIAVAASDEKDKAASFSSNGPEVNIIAPGVDISSTYKNQDYKHMSGTSMACPHVVGALALLLSISGANTKNAKSAILNTAKDIGLPKENQGAGLVKVSAAVSNIKKPREDSIVDNKFEELKKELKGSMKTPSDLGDILLKFGITPESPETLKQVIKDAGIDEEELKPENAAEMVKNITENLSPEMKKYMAGMIESISGAITDIPMPDDVQKLIKSWKCGGKTEEES